MRKVIRHRSQPSITFNVTPMIDIVFLLIIFFILVSRFADAEQAPMNLPGPENSQAKNLRMTDRVIINVQLAKPDDPNLGDVIYRIGPAPAESLASIAERLALHKQYNPKVKVIIRADRLVRYGVVREVMELAAEQGIEVMNIAAYVGEPGAAP